MGHIILVSHAAISAPTDAEARHGATTAGEMFIAPWPGSEERLSAQNVAELQHQFREGLHARFRRQLHASRAVGERLVLRGPDHETRAAH